MFISCRRNCRLVTVQMFGLAHCSAKLQQFGLAKMTKLCSDLKKLPSPLLSGKQGYQKSKVHIIKTAQLHCVFIANSIAKSRASYDFSFSVIADSLGKINACWHSKLIFHVHILTCQIIMQDHIHICGQVFSEIN